MHTEETFSESNFSENKAKVTLCYDIDDPFLFEFRDDIHQALERSLPTEAEVQQYLTASSIVVPIVDIVIFASTTIVTSLLTKFAEDIYNIAKKKLTKTRPKKEELGQFYRDQSQLQIWIVTEEAITGGRVSFKDYNTAIQAIKNTPDMLSHTNEAIKIAPQEAPTIYLPFFKDRYSTIKSGFVFSYRFDTTNERWVLERINRAEKQTQSDAALDAKTNTNSDTKDNQ